MITPQDGVVIARRYTLTRPLARGGMGSVWVARHRELDVDVSDQVHGPLARVAADARARFEREAKAAARLDSQHVVQVHDYGVETTRPTSSWSCSRGETLATRLSRERRLSPSAAARLVVQVCRALRRAHDAGIVHRDLKPSNVFLAMKDDDEVVKVLDFGIAKSADLGQSGTGSEAGTHHRLAALHEPRAGAEPGHRRRPQRSLVPGGHRLPVLAGRLPFPGKDATEVLVQVCTDEAPAPSTIAPELPPRLDGFFVRALARDPAHRFQSARELAEAFCSIAMEAQPGLGAQVSPLSSPQPSSKRTMRWTCSLSPGPALVRRRRLRHGQDPGRTQIMRSAPPGPRSGPPPGTAEAPPPPAGDGDDDATLAHPSHSSRRPSLVEPTLRAVGSDGGPSEGPPYPPGLGPLGFGEVAPPDLLADDPPSVPVHSFRPAWVALGVVVAGALAFAAFRGASPGDAPGPAAAAAQVTTAESPRPAPSPSATPTPVETPRPPEPAAAASAPPAAASAPPAIASVATVTAAVTASATSSAGPAPSAPPRGPLRVKSQIVDGIIRDPFGR